MSTDRDTIDPRQAALVAATLGVPTPREGDPLPPLWHWAWFLRAVPEAGLGRDGHPARGRWRS